MIKTTKSYIIFILVFLLSVLPSAYSRTWLHDGHRAERVNVNTHYHNGYHRDYYDHGYYDRGYYGGGGFFFGGGWAPPSVIINVPVERYYVPACREVEVCDNYTGQCWIERSCN